MVAVAVREKTRVQLRDVVRVLVFLISADGFGALSQNLAPLGVSAALLPQVSYASIKLLCAAVQILQI